MVKLSFKGQVYNSIYSDFVEAIKDVRDHPYHGPKLHTLLRSIGKEGW
jgi:hypothetical protein